MEWGGGPDHKPTGCGQQEHGWSSCNALRPIHAYQTRKVACKDHRPGVVKLSDLLQMIIVSGMEKQGCSGALNTAWDHKR